jgi:flagellar motor switch protein FliM
VELSVNGKVVARGELVEVEGQLGVRVISLAG